MLFLLPGEDAVLAVDHGASGVIVSNHGGRMQDALPASVGRNTVPRDYFVCFVSLFF